jgi:hypothetical protein
MPMRRGAAAALVVGLLLPACGTPTGVERHGCVLDAIRDAQVVITRPGGAEERPIPIDCMHDIGRRRLRIGFTLPPGPECHVLSRIEVHETADAITVTLVGGVIDDPAAGACPDEPTRAVTDVDVAAPVDERVLLDGGVTPRASESASP